ncbi:thioredoxin family protein [Candidatus Aenigmatarchaeota archaeon]
MALVESSKISMGTKMPDFVLKDPDNEEHKSDKLFDENGLLVIFTCNHCPYAIAQWDRMKKLALHARKLKINTVAINPNINPNYPDDSPENMKKLIQELGITFSYLVDEKQEIARKFDARCTPDLYLYDKNQKLVYHGRMDDNWEDESAVTKEELKEAIDNLGNGKEIIEEQKPSMGCSIKWV